MTRLTARFATSCCRQRSGVFSRRPPSRRRWRPRGPSGFGLHVVPQAEEGPGRTARWKRRTGACLPSRAAGPVVMSHAGTIRPTASRPDHDDAAPAQDPVQFRRALVPGMDVVDDAGQQRQVEGAAREREIPRHRAPGLGSCVSQITVCGTNPTGRTVLLATSWRTAVVRRRPVPGPFGGVPTPWTRSRVRRDSAPLN